MFVNSTPNVTRHVSSSADDDRARLGVGRGGAGAPAPAAARPFAPAKAGFGMEGRRCGLFFALRRPMYLCTEGGKAGVMGEGRAGGGVASVGKFALCWEY